MGRETMSKSRGTSVDSFEVWQRMEVEFEETKCRGRTWLER